jgi:hypothetical protein
MSALASRKRVELNGFHLYDLRSEDTNHFLIFHKLIATNKNQTYFSFPLHLHKVNMSDQERNEHNEPQTIINATETKAEEESDHSQNQNALPNNNNNNNNKYGDLTNLLHAAAALSQLPGHESSAGQETTDRSNNNPSIPVSDDDAKTVPSTTKEDEVPQHDMNPPPSYRPPIYHTNGILLVPSSNHTHMMQIPQQLHASDYGQDGKKKRPYTNTRHTFPLKLMEILNSKYNFSDIIRWSENGTSFQVIDPNKLCETVLPLYFPGEKVKYPSFTRKLNRWGFRQISRGPDGGAFFHEVSCSSNELWTNSRSVATLVSHINQLVLFE